MYFFETTVKCKNVKRKDGTHLAILNGRKIRYLISCDSGLWNRARKVLSNSVSPYSRKLGLLMDCLTWIPVFALRAARLGRIVSVTLPEEILTAMTKVAERRWPQKKWTYNIIVGSYVEKQKIVIQCFTDDLRDVPIYVKVCADNARVELENETNYLSAPIQSQYFKNPKLCYSILQKDGVRFNIQVTEEFSGSKVEPEMTQEIYRLFQEIAKFRCQETIDGRLLCFSHGDFVPWNLRRTRDYYIIFDWEYCGMRFYGFDLIHYLWQIHNKLMGQDAEKAIRESIQIAKEYDEYLRSLPDEYIENQYFTELRMQFGEVL